MGVNIGISIPRETHKEGKRFLVVGGGEGDHAVRGVRPNALQKGPLKNVFVILWYQKCITSEQLVMFLAWGAQSSLYKPCFNLSATPYTRNSCCCHDPVKLLQAFLQQLSGDLHAKISWLGS